MKYLLLLLLTVATSLQAQTLKARDVFQQMPDSILPYLTTTNRLDMLDFMDSHMKARIQNRFDGTSEMLSLADDSLTIQLSSVQRMTLRLLMSDTEIDGSHQLICIERAIGSLPIMTKVVYQYFSVLWRKLDIKGVNLVN